MNTIPQIKYPNVYCQRHFCVDEPGYICCEHICRGLTIEIGQLENATYESLGTVLCDACAALDEPPLDSLKLVCGRCVAEILYRGKREQAIRQKK